MANRPKGSEQSKVATRGIKLQFGSYRTACSFLGHVYYLIKSKQPEKSFPEHLVKQVVTGFVSFPDRPTTAKSGTGRYG
jgi:hypothetical protein